MISQAAPVGYVARAECRLVGVSRMQPTYRGDGTPDRTGSLFLSYSR